MFWQKKWNVIRSLEFVGTQKPSSGLRGSVGQYWTKPICDDMGEGEFCGIWGGSGVLKTLRGHEVEHSEALLAATLSGVMFYVCKVMSSSSRFNLHVTRPSKRSKNELKSDQGEFLKCLAHDTIKSYPQFVWKTGGQRKRAQKVREGWIAKLSKNLSFSLCTEAAMWRMQETFS